MKKALDGKSNTQYLKVLKEQQLRTKRNSNNRKTTVGTETKTVWYKPMTTKARAQDPVLLTHQVSKVPRKWLILKEPPRQE
jgi:hypothetical protein